VVPPRSGRDDASDDFVTRNAFSLKARLLPRRSEATEPSPLRFGDCVAHASEVAALCVGGNFLQTDLELVQRAHGWCRQSGNITFRDAK
jgi:hypothetical protein